uniref:Uncharacterized protein n=1 Tax=Arundo donax TaxID=35708 RepID=A0A0A8ZP72_ARUDO
MDNPQVVGIWSGTHSMALIG